MKENRQEKSTIKRNILQYLDYKGISNYKFYKDTGITRGILGQNNGMSEENTSRFLDYYREVNAEWLITGKGEMLKSDNENLQEKANPEEIIELQRKIIALQEENFKLKEENLKLKVALGSSDATDRTKQKSA